MVRGIGRRRGADQLVAGLAFEQSMAMKGGNRVFDESVIVQ